MPLGTDKAELILLSSILSVLFRLVPLEDGQIIIDSVDVGKIGLHHLRSKLSIIPQGSFGSKVCCNRPAHFRDFVFDRPCYFRRDCTTQFGSFIDHVGC
jgi:ABC-type enterochelin transport system ATPase subunit